MSAAKRKANRKGAHAQARDLLGRTWKLITVGIPLVEGAGYGEYAIYEPSHYSKWRDLQKSGAAPTDCEYEEFPRGRVMFNRTTETFLLLADTCILGDKRVLAQIMEEMHLPRPKPS